MSHQDTGSHLRVVRDDEQRRMPRASRFLRAGARVSDVILAWVVYTTTGPAGVVMAVLYLLFADGMFQGQSVGKKLFGIKVMHLPSRRGALFRDSVLRNGPFGFVVILSMMPEIGKIAFLVSGATLLLVEGIQVLRDEDGQRLGDEWAQTQVIDGKVPMDPPLRARHPAAAHASGQVLRSALRRVREGRGS